MYLTAMKKYLLPFLLFSSFGAVADIDPALIKQMKKVALESDLAYTTTHSLTTEVGARIAGSEGDKRAVAWAEKKFVELGFDKVYKEPVRVRNWTRGIAVATINNPFKQNLVVTALGGTIATPEGGLTEKVVMFDSLESLTNADKAQVEGKIVFVNKRMQRDKQGRGYGRVVAARARGAVEAAKLGAKAIVIRSVGTDSSRFAHTGMMRYDDDVEKIPAGALSNADADTLGAMFAHNKDVEITLNLQAKEAGWQTSYNVIGEITGSKYPEQIVLISAHLDSWDEGTGALDDGAGVGIVMATAALLKQQHTPERTIRVVLYANEEFGLVGARQYVKDHKDEFAHHVVAAESDFGAGRVWQFTTRFGEDADTKRAVYFEHLKDLGVEEGNNEARGGPDISMLPNHGVPVVSLSQDGTYYFDYHHTPNDTFDKINKEDMAQNVAAWSVFTYIAANSGASYR